MKIYIRLVLLFALIVNSAFAQGPTFVFHQLSIKDGLSENTVRAIIEDNRGFMWFGTEGGLNKYDGYKFTTYKNNIHDKYSISTNDLKCLYNDSKGNLWAGGRQGLNFYSHVKDKFFNYNSSKLISLKNIKYDIDGIYEDAKHNMWIAATYEGLFKIASLTQPAQNFKFYPGAGQPSLVISTVVEDKGNFLWVGSGDGLLKFDLLTNKFIDTRDLYGHGYHIRTILNEKDYLWLATSKGIKRVDKKTGLVKSYSHIQNDKSTVNGDNTFKIIALPGNKFLIGIDGGGVDLFDATKETFTHYTTQSGSELSSNNTTSIYLDSKGTVWTGTFLNGLNYSNETTNFFVMMKNKPASSKYIGSGIVSNFLKDSKGNLWVSTDGGGLNLKLKGSENYIHFSARDQKQIIGSDAVISLLEDKEKNVWIATYDGGLSRVRYPDQVKIFKNIPSDPQSPSNTRYQALCEYNDEIWASTYGTGIDVFNKKTQSFRHYRYKSGDAKAIPSDWVHCFLKDDEGVLWIGTFSGLVKYDPKTDSFRSFFFTDQVATNKNHIFQVYQDSKKNIWLATKGGGLVLFDRKKEKFVSFTEQDGLPDNCVKTIIEDNYGNLWLAGNGGVAKFEIASAKVVPYTINEGLPPSSFFNNSKYKDEQGKIYFGTNEGYLVIDPRLSVQKNIFPNVVITELKVANEPVKVGKKNSLLNTNVHVAKGITLPYHKNSLSFEFAALNFSIPRKVQYAYKLEGFDKDWVFAGKNRTATYTNLDPGKYIFKVSASNNDKIWGKHETRFKIVIKPPFWQTWWFRLIIALVGLLVIRAIFYLRTKNIRDRNKWLQLQVEERTADLEKANVVLENKNTEVVRQSDIIMSQQKELLDKKYNLEKSNEYLADWNRFQNRLIGILGHDIRGPLQKFSFMLNESQHAQPDIKKLRDQAESLSLLATDLLSWVTIQSSKGEVDLSVFSWKEAIEKVTAELDPLLSEKNISVNVMLDDTTFVKSSYPVVHSTIRNIISNAIRYSENGGMIEIGKGPDKNGCIALRITDFAQGFDSEVINKLIQGDAFNGVKEKSLKGSAGLGMAICYDAIKRTGGWIEAASLPGSGGTFYVYLPASDTQQSELVAETKKEVEPPTEDRLKSLRGRKILLVDDDDEIRWEIVKLLSKYTEVHEVRNGEEALEWLENNTPDMALLDIEIPGTNGLELCKRIKNSPATAHVPCTIISGKEGEMVRPNAFSAGADAFLSKPFKPDELLIQISGYFENQARKIKRFLNEGAEVDQLTDNPLNKDFISRLLLLVENNLSNEQLNVDFLASEMGLSRAGLYRKLKSLTGQTANDFIVNVRMRKSLSLLKDSNLNISEVAHETGFSSPSYFTTSFKKHFGYSPNELKK